VYDVCIPEQVQRFYLHNRAPFHLLQDVMQGFCQSIAVLLFVSMPKVLEHYPVIPPAETDQAVQHNIAFLKRAVQPDTQSAILLVHVACQLLS
jgi:hypothetical protein